MELKEIRRERVLADIISDRDAMIDILVQENEKLKEELKAVKKEGK